MGSADRRRKGRAAKRKFTSNQHSINNKKETTGTAATAAAVTDIPVSTDISSCSQRTIPESSSAKKIKLSQPTCDSTVKDGQESYIFFNTNILKNLIHEVGRCPNCSSSSGLDFVHDVAKKNGLAHKFNLTCRSCSWKNETFSSRKLPNTRAGIHGRGKKAFEINTRTIIAFREIGKGYSALTTFCRCINMPPPMAQTSFDNLMDNIHVSYVKSARSSMIKAAEEVIPDLCANDVVRNATASFDGSWQRRGYASLNGVVTAIASGKCVDVEVLTKTCKACKYWNRRKGTPEYERWKAEHNCIINHTGSAGAMESIGVKRMYERSVTVNKLRYIKYRGDGDSKSYSDIAKLKPYGPDYDIVKSECVGPCSKACWFTFA